MISRPSSRSQAATGCGLQRARHYGFPDIGPRAKIGLQSGQAVRGIEHAFVVLTIVSAMALIVAVSAFVFGFG
jgi:hypothetical protein